jgi:hypothetical protein
MSSFRQLHSQLLRDGEITDAEVGVIQDYLHSDGELDLDDVKFLVGVRCEARRICPAFDRLFFPLLRQVLLKDARIGQDEQFYLLKMLYSDGHITDSERKFLDDLRSELSEVSPEFDALCGTALAAAPTNWDLGGR